MPLSPVDIHNKDFKKVLFGGYNRDEVDEFLDLLIQEFEKHLREIASLKEQVQVLTEKLGSYHNLEESLNRALLAAQETADNIRQTARREADLIIQEARLQGQRVIEAGEDRGRRIIAEYAEVQRTAEVLRVQLRAVLQSHLELLDRYLPAGPVTAATLLSQVAEVQAAATLESLPAAPTSAPSPDPEPTAPSARWDSGGEPPDRRGTPDMPSTGEG